MNPNNALQRAQLYRFLTEAFLYPLDDWTPEVHLVNEIVAEMGWLQARLEVTCQSLEELQAAHRFAFGLAGSLCYETEYGLPHEYRQSQELADLAGFYRAFGFQVGGPKRERPDHLVVELEFMSLLALKTALASQAGNQEQVEICMDASRKFLEDHLGKWIEIFRQSLTLTVDEGVFRALAEFTSKLVLEDAVRLGATIQPLDPAKTRSTPIDPDVSCASECPIGQFGQTATSKG